jgi:hypothetical protein
MKHVLPKNRRPAACKSGRDDGAVRNHAERVPGAAKGDHSHDYTS